MEAGWDAGASEAPADPFYQPVKLSGGLQLWPLDPETHASLQGGQQQLTWIDQQRHFLAEGVAQERHRCPPLLNDRSLFTKAATFGNKADPYYHSPSARIANHFTPSALAAASHLFEEGVQSPNAARKAGSASPTKGVQGSVISQQQLVNAIKRYNYYIEMGIDDKHVAPYREEWAANALSLLPARLQSNMSTEQYEELINICLAEMHTGYVAAVKQSIVDYTLRSSVERQRLNMEALAPLLDQAQNSRVVGWNVPESWRADVAAAREEIAWTLQTLSANALELSELWISQGFASKLLLDVESVEFRRALPMEADAFKSWQQDCCERVKGSLWTNWLPKTVEVFRRILPVFINGDAEAYYRSIAVLQGNQLRSLAQNSFSAYERFFRQYQAVCECDPQQDKLFWSAPPAFAVELCVDAEARPCFRPTFDDMEAVVCNAMEQAVAVTSGIPRVGSQEGTTAGNVSPGRSSKGATIPCVSLEDESLRTTLAEIRAILQANQEAPAALAGLLAPFMYLVGGGAGAVVQQFGELESPPTLEEYATQIDKLHKAAADIKVLCTDAVRTGLYIVRCQAVKEQLASAAEGTARALLDQIRATLRSSNERVCECYQEMTTELAKVSHSSEEVLALKKYISRCQSEQDRLREEIAGNKARDDFLEAYRFAVPEEDFEVAMRAYEWPKKMVAIMKDAIGKANGEHRDFESALKKRRKDFADLLDKYQAEVDKYEARAEMARRDEIASQVTTLSENLKQAAEEADQINVQEKLFGWATTKYGQVAKMIAKLEPYTALWTLAARFYDKYAGWMSGPFSKLAPEEVEGEVSDAFRKVYKLTKVFGDNPACEAAAKVAEECKAKIASFQELLPLVNAICNAGLRERHWTTIAELVGLEIRPDEVTSLRRLLDYGIQESVAEIAEISDHASREWSIEKALNKMTEDWKGLALELAEWKATGTYILRGGPLDEAQALLDDHLIKSQAMAASPFAKAFADEIVPWERKLSRLQSILDQWLTCQGKWLYLEPIFGSEEIMKQIPREGTAFREMDATWRRIMTKVKEQPIILQVAGFPNLLEDLQRCNSQLDIVEKGLNDLLDTKKMAFPRFFFLSNDELLEILAEAKEPTNVQPFVKKCFEAVKEFRFEASGDISGMVSIEGEKIEWVESVRPSSSGAVEVWMGEVEGVIKRTLHKLAGEALAAYATTERSTWILQWPGQLVLNCSQVYWTREVTDAIRSGGARGLAAYAGKCTTELNKIVSLVRGQLTSLERATCGALVVIDVHARDVVQQMAADKVESEKDFKWESQLRYYWEHHDAPPSGVSPQETLMVRMINADALYGYEYLGNSGRLVITPLTDRCYRTLIGAIHMNLGGAPAGPAGTGKTETTKDLSKALAIQCVVFNCSDGLDYKAMGKFFKGLACSGAWACFDEFNRIELEVLSVVAQQVLTIQRAKAAKVRTFVFEGVDLRLVPTCNVFITMNPGYAGRSELPDNLKALFRDVAMMVPDYGMIAEIMLYSYGYLDARSMARKLVQTYRLCSEQLSSQDHYDYGMRAVMSVLRAAGNLKREFTEEAEDVLMLRAINDVNLPKFLDQDVPLFNGILSDLFPGVALPRVDYDNLRAAIKDNCIAQGLQPLESFIIKTIQLYEMIIVRHGLMLVGQSFGMKTSAYRVLAAALSDLNAKGLNNEHKVKTFVLNPKAVTMGQLYGAEDPVSKEWTDGVLAVLFRNAARDTSPDRKWLVFDGPVDAIWIENMNTVLDDNKKLCLNSGEIVAMSGLMNMIFEVADLAVASPATVSRCGMVYMQPALLGWRPLLTSWMDKLPPALPETLKTQMVSLFEWLVPPMLRVATKMIRAPVPMHEINLVASCMRLLDSLLDEYRSAPSASSGPAAIKGETSMSSQPADVLRMSRPTETGTELPDNLQAVSLQSVFLFSLVWSIGGNTDEEGRKTFDRLLRKLLINDPAPELKPFIKAPSVKITQLFPEGKSVYAFMFDKAKCKWVAWSDIMDATPLPPDAEYTQIIVPTVDTVRYTFLLNQLVTHHQHCLLVGPTGTGKTAYVKKHLQSGLDASFTSLFFNFSAQTSANMTQDIVDGKLDKRRKGVYGPPVGKRMVIFVDDLNMPQVEEYGAQPPIELLRQFMDHQGWYDRKELSFRKLLDVQFVSAMGPPGGGRNSVTARYLRHFSIISVTAFDHDTLTTIFSSLVDWWMKRAAFGPNVTKFAKPLVAATLEVYETIQQELLPTPTKSHYTFNLRDVSKIFQGLTRAGSAIEEGSLTIRLWIHETLRVFHDRLVNDEDRQWLATRLAAVTEKHFKEKLPKVLAVPGANPDDAAIMAGLRGLMFGDFMVAGAVPRVYTEVGAASRMLTVVNEYLADYNAVSKSPMNLVLFLFALEHVSRLCRILTSPGGHALLVGLGGSGRQSLSRLAAHMEEYEVFQIEISKTYGKVEWHEDLKKVLKMAGEADKKVVFLFADTQIKQESFVEDISNLLNTYEVPNLLQPSDLATVFENIQPRAKAAGMEGSRDQLYNFFLQEVKRNLHIVLSFSPVGAAFRDRLRKFPSLVNCTTIDWFSQWPRDALHTVAANFLSELAGVDPQVCKQLPELCVMFHESVHTLGERFLAKERRHTYVTPTSYLELLHSYRNLLARKQKEVVTLKQRYEVGLEKLAATESSVTGMQEELIALQPQLEQSTVETEAALVVIASETEEADKVKEVVSREEAIASQEAAKVKAIKDDCEADLAEALPMLADAIKALETLTKNDITEVKGMKSPPAGVKLVLEAVCILKNVKPIRGKDPTSGKMVDDYWEASKKMLMEADFLPSLRDFDKDHIPAAIIDKIRPFIINPEFEPKKVAQASKAAHGLCCWVRAMQSYDRVIKIVEPKKKKLAESEAELEVVMTALRAKQEALQAVLQKLAALDADLNEKRTKKARLESDIHLCRVKLDRAQKLITGLGGEKSRWTLAAEALGGRYTRLTGDVLLAAAQIAYLGPFTSLYRTECLASWVSACQAAGVPCSSRFSLPAALGDAVKIRQWNIWGLPKDDISSENAIAVDQGRRWPLCIDPQGTANKWVRNMEKEAGLLVVKLTDPNYLRTLENAIQFGKPVLMENVGEVLDASLEPLLQKQTFRQGGTMCIRLGDTTVEYSEEFRFYITTKLRNPHYAPELCTKVSLLNFMTTREGLEDQLLGIVVAKERPELEEEKNRLILAGAENKRRLQEIEDEILRVLSASQGNILEDEDAVNILQSSKVLADDISDKQKIADETEIKIDAARAGYKPVAHHASVLYFCVTDLGNIDPMYQYSLAWFVGLFVRAIADSAQSDDLDVRLQLLNDHFTFFLYQNVCRSLFEKDKLLFAFGVAAGLQMDAGRMSGAELRFLLTGGVAVGDLPAPNPAPAWLSEKSWGEICRAAQLPSPIWKGLAQHVAEHLNDWKRIYDALEPDRTPLPEPWRSKLDSFQRILALRTLRPDKLLPALTGFVAEALGKRFVDPKPFAIEPSYNDSSSTTPLIFVLSPGSDPTAALLRFAEERGVRVEAVSLGQGQGPVAQRWIDEGAKEGFWVVLQNCHLAKSFLPTLELICEQQLVPDKVHRNFRLWLTSYPSPIFPISILENGIKMTNEAPRGLRAGLLRTYMSDPFSTQTFFEGCQQAGPFRKLMFGLAFFHSIVQERRKFGPIGWNIPYEFNENDLRISARQLKMFLDEYPQIPFDTLQYTCGECNYGGKVTDAHDRHTLMTILCTYYTEPALTTGYKFSPSGVYNSTDIPDHKGYLEYVANLPLAASPEVFGLHENADITKDLKETGLLLESLLLTLSRDASGGGKSVEATIGEVATDILTHLPANFDTEAVAAKYPQDYHNSMNTVLVQELSRVNALLNVVRSSLTELGKAVKGLALMSTELDAVGRALFDGKVPAMWLKKSFPSLKALGAYVKEVVERCQFFQDWIDNGAPTVFWISCFFFTQAFMTGAKQNFARKCRIPIDQIDFDFEIMDGPNDCKAPPEDGIYCRGLFIEGCRWDWDYHTLAESEPKVLFTAMPVMWMIPKEVSKFAEFQHYVCPMYKTTERRGVLSTTGHSTNFVMDVRLPSTKPAAHWTKRGVALLTTLDD
ncbi:hypothetical protein WJX72_004356 [[Myrmecia] bisecta]|uniref:Dynein heavy chain n=1 Tax=[Myrmecia] bisecta TaxID=41462 RepID=A0AAW1PWR8_9CHLO